MTAWEDWQRDRDIWDFDAETPYASWWRTVMFPETAEVAPPSEGGPGAPEFNSFSDFVEHVVAGFASLARVMPTGAGLPGDVTRSAWADHAIRATPPAAGTPIVGVVDDGIALSHSGFRAAETGTRILTAWQQSAQWGTPAGLTDQTDPQDHLPFGNELHQQDIRALIDAHSAGGDVDEDSFNRAAGLVDMYSDFGQRMLNNRDAHGTHVADIACGGSDAALVFVNLPSRTRVGLSGTFVEQLLMMGILRIVSVADRLWQQAGHSAGSDGVSGYPITINMSFSKMAGARTALTEFGLFMDSLNDVRKRLNLSKVYFIFPAGNDNLLEGVGRIAALKPREERSLILDVPPEDQSSSYVEIWTRGERDSFGEKAPLKIAVEGPGTLAPWTELSQAKHGRFKTLSSGGRTLARLFSSVGALTTVLRLAAPPALNGADAGEAGDMQRYLLAICPTLSYDGRTAQAPAGRWKITLRNRSDADKDVVVSVQSDQSALPASVVARRPRLVDEEYERITEEGRVRDSYDRVTGAYSDTPQDMGFVFRHGTLNALASAGLFATDDGASDSNNAIFIASGYRASDDRPAPYSSTGIDALSPSAAFPTDDGATLFGILASGSREGSKVAYRGTSFAAAQATREIAALQADADTAGFTLDLVDALASRARPTDPAGQMTAKIGAGRLPRSGSPLRVSR